MRVIRHNPIYSLAPKQISLRQKGGDLLMLAGLYLSKPIHLASEPFLRSVFTPIRPGKWGNWSSKLLERIRRIVSVILCLVSLPLTLPAALLGSGLQKIADWVKGVPYTHYIGSAPAHAPRKTRCYMTLNACMLWGGLPIPLGGIGPPRERMAGVARMIQDQDPDVLVMQEVAFDAANTLYGHLKANYAHFFTRIGPNPLRMESGLFIASKYPVSRVGWIPFPHQNGVFRGAFFIETPNGFFFTTHLEFGKEKEKMRQEQLALITKQMDALEKKKPCYLLGDLNLSPKEYPKLTESFFDPMGNDPLEASAKTATCANHMPWARCGGEKPTEEWEVVDFALIREGRAAQNLKRSCERLPCFSMKEPEKALSDHHAILLTETLQ